MTRKTIQTIFILTTICTSFAYGQVTKEKLFDNGLKVFEKGFFISAIEYFDRAIAMDSTYAIAYYYRGLSYKKGTQADIHHNVISNFKKAIQLDTTQNFWEAYYYLALKAQFIDTSYYTLFDKAIYFQPNNADIYSHRGLFYYYWHKKDYTKALADFEKSIELDSKNVTAISGLAFYYDTQKNDFHKALDYYNKAIQLKPKDTGLLFNRAQIHCKLDNKGKLKKDLTTLTNMTVYIYTSDKDCNLKLKKKNNP